MPVAGKGKKGDEGEGEEDEEDSHEVDPYTIVGADTAADSGQRGGEGEVEVCVEESMHPKCSPRVRLVQSKPLPGEEGTRRPLQTSHILIYITIISATCLLRCQMLISVSR